MSANAKRFALMVAALSIISVALASCQAPASPVTPASSSNSGVNVFRTPNTSLASPSPTFPPFTVGAWPSNYSPANDDNITIYVLCRQQDQSMNGPSQPAANLDVTVVIGDPVNTTASGRTDTDGLAAIPVQLHDPYSGKPVVVQVTVNFGNVSYTAQTFFTPSPTAKPTPTGKAGGTPGPTVTATP